MPDTGDFLTDFVAHLVVSLKAGEAAGTWGFRQILGYRPIVNKAGDTPLIYCGVPDFAQDRGGADENVAYPLATVVRRLNCSVVIVGRDLNTPNLEADMKAWVSKVADWLTAHYTIDGYCADSYPGRGVMSTWDTGQGIYAIATIEVAATLPAKSITLVE
jgi:hypothetical protein